MSLLIHTFFQNQTAGIFDMDEADRQGRFEWLPTFQSTFANLTTILPPNESNRCITFDAKTDLPLLFRDYLPGSFAKSLLKEALRNTSRTVESLSTLAWLSLTGDRGMGGFRFEPAGYPELNAVEPVDLDRMVRYAALITQGKGSELSDRRLRELLRCSLFVKGSSPKILVAINDYTGEVLSGQSAHPTGYEDWIVKLDGVVANSAERLANEYAFYKKALICDIAVAPCRMLRDGHWKHLLIKRFDRQADEKRAYITCPSTIDSWEGVFQMLRTYRLPYPDMDEMFKRLVFSTYTKNESYGTDKICLTYSSKEQWRLAPAFNLKPSIDKQRLSLLGKTQDWTTQDLLKFGKLMNIRKASKIVANLSAILL